MKCARCNRPLDRITAQIGAMAFGPTCAARMGLLAAVKGLKKPRGISVVPRSRKSKPVPDQFDLFQDEKEANGT